MVFIYKYRVKSENKLEYIIIIKLASLHAFHSCNEFFFFFFFGSKFSRNIIEKEATKTHIEQSKSYEQYAKTDPRGD